MKAKDLQVLLAVIGRIDDRVLYEIATCPLSLVKDEADRTIVNVARGEQAWRLECQR